MLGAFGRSVLRALRRGGAPGGGPWPTRSLEFRRKIGARIVKNGQLSCHCLDEVDDVEGSERFLPSSARVIGDPRSGFLAKASEANFGQTQWR